MSLHYGCSDCTVFELDETGHWMEMFQLSIFGRKYTYTLCSFLHHPCRFERFRFQVSKCVLSHWWVTEVGFYTKLARKGSAPIEYNENRKKNPPALFIKLLSIMLSERRGGRLHVSCAFRCVLEAGNWALVWVMLATTECPFSVECSSFSQPQGRMGLFFKTADDHTTMKSLLGFPLLLVFSFISLSQIFILCT